MPALSPTTPEPTSRATAPPVVEAVDLVKTYGKGAHAVRALDGVSFTAAAGEVLGVLGPNGAGKSTTVRVLTTLALPDSGAARVAGYDVRRQADEVRRSIGYVSQRPGFDPVGTGWENLVLQGRLRGMGRAASRQRAEELLRRFDLDAAARRPSRTWSGGMQRKLDVAMALMHRPQVLFLDEPTTGLDPQARSELWGEIARLATQDGVCVLLTTHYLDEADRLASRLLIVDRGRVVVSGTPHELKAALARDGASVDLGDVYLHHAGRRFSPTPDAATSLEQVPA